MKKLVVAAQYLTAGAGGISRLGRLSIQALQDVCELDVRAVEDRSAHDIGCTRVRAFRGRRMPFVVAHNFAMLSADFALYDFPGTGRAHLVPTRAYAVWVCGNEVWDAPPMRSDYARVVRRADRVLVISARTGDALQQALGPLPQMRTVLLATEQEDPIVRRSRNDHPPTLLFVGRNDPGFPKGQDLLVRLWPRVVAGVPDARLRFVGSGQALEPLRELARQSSARERIEVLGFVPEETMDGVWREATAFALPSSLEGFGLVIIEAMRHGVPVIASTQDAGCEINADEQTGYNVDRSDEDRWVDRIVALLSNAGLAKRLGDGGVARWREHFRPSSFRQRLRSALALD